MALSLSWLASTGCAFANGGPTILGELPYQTLLNHKLSSRATLRVNVANGNVVLKSEELNIIGVQLPFVATRYFNDQAATNGSLGRGGTLNIGPDVSISPNADGSATYQGPSGFRVTFPANGSGGYTTASAYTQATLARIASGGWTLTFNESREVYTFNSAGLLLKDASAAGEAISYSYGATGTLASVVDTEGRTISVTRAASGPYIGNIMDPTGRTITYTYNASNQLTAVREAGPGETWAYGYDASGNLSSIQDPGGNTTSLTYNGSHQVVSITYPGSRQYTFAYNTGNTVVTDALGHAATYSYDGAGRVTTVVDADGDSTATAWDSSNNIRSTTDSAGATTTFSYNALNALTAVTNPSLPGGQAGAQTLYTYGDTANPYLPTQVTDAQGNTVAYSYDRGGNLLTAKPNSSGMGPTTSTFQGDTTSSGATVTCGGQPGELCTSTDANGNLTIYGYDAKGNLTSTTPPGGLSKETIAYDGLSRPVRRTDGNSNTETITYDADDQVTGDGSSSGTTTTIYDRDGNKTMVINGGVTTGYTYDASNRVTSSRQVNTTINYTYDAASNLTSESAPVGSTTYSYDRANHLVGVQNGCMGAGQTFVYDRGRVTAMTLPGGVTETLGYDQDGREISLRAAKGATDLESFAGTYTTASGKDSDLLQAETDNLAGIRTAYSYDGLNRLTAALQAGAGANSYSYAYDANGNLTQSSHNGVANPTLGFNAVNELVTANGSPSGSFDGAGNQTATRGGLRIAYNAIGQATSFTPASGNTQGAVYAGADQASRTQIGATSEVNGVLGLYSDLAAGSSPSAGNATSCSASNTNTTSTAVTINNGSPAPPPAPPSSQSTITGTGAGSTNTVTDSTTSTSTTTNSNTVSVTNTNNQTATTGGTNVSGNTTSGGTAPTSGTTSTDGPTYYMHLPTGDHDVIAEVMGTTAFYYLFDLHGSVVGVTNSNGARVDTYSYDPYGNLVASTGSVANPWRWQGGYYDSGTGLYKFGIRYYNPADGRWTQTDPSGEEPGYVYGGDDPVNESDPSGALSKKSFSKGGLKNLEKRFWKHAEALKHEVFGKRGPTSRFDVKRHPGENNRLYLQEKQGPNTIPTDYYQEELPIRFPIEL